MNRRHFILAAIAAGLAACTPVTGDAAPRFEPTRFSVEVRGQGPDVILIPGLTAGREVWSATAQAVPGYRYHLIQVSGFAGEPARGNAQGPVVAPLADEIGRYIVASGLRRPAIIGHSMGGTLAMMVAAQRPDAVGKVMVVDMLPQPSGLLGSSAGNMGPLADALRDIAGTPGGRRLFESLLGSFSPPGTPNGRSDPDVVARAMHELSRIDLGPSLTNIRAPLTVVYAVPDPRTRAMTQRQYETSYAGARGARLVRIDDSGHMVMQDQPGPFRTAFRDFLAR
jgi:N-formylmaleamate deformylase